MEDESARLNDTASPKTTATVSSNNSDPSSLTKLSKNRVTLKPLIYFIPFTIIFFLYNEFVAEPCTPNSIANNATLAFEWKNIMTSQIHATVQAVFTLFIVFTQLEVLTGKVAKGHNFWESSPKYANILFSITVGYFVYDTLDMFIRARNTLTVIIVLHHFISVAVIAFLLAQQFYKNFGVWGMLFEVHSSIYHIRNLMIIVGSNSKDNAAFLFLVVVNYLLLAVFRFGTCGFILFLMYKFRTRCRSRVAFWSWAFIMVVFIYVNIDLTISTVKKDIASLS